MEKEFKMPKEFGEKWLDALESGKYDKGSCVLKSGKQYCCLGVACDLVGMKDIKGGLPSDMYNDPNYDKLPELLQGGWTPFHIKITQINDSSMYDGFSGVISFIQNNVEFT